MNLTEFLAYREFCPLCFNRLNFHCKSKFNHNIKYINDKLNVEVEVISYALSPTKKNHFKVILILDLNSNEFEVDFLNSIEESLTAVSLDRIETFKLHCNGINNLFVYKTCVICSRYEYSGDVFFNYSLKQVRGYTINYEHVMCSSSTDGKVRKYVLHNNYYVNKSTLYISADNSIDEQISTSIIPITNSENLIDQFNMLSVFS